MNKEKVGTRYALVALSILVDPNDPKDLAAAHTLQDAVSVRQPTAGRFEIPNWDAATP